MSSKIKSFDYSNNYLETIISKILCFNTKKMGYSENGVVYYYWYDIKEKQFLLDNVDEIKKELNKVEKCNVNIDTAQCEENEVALILYRLQNK